jgi:hypothetical protein
LNHPEPTPSWFDELTMRAAESTALAQDLMMRRSPCRDLILSLSKDEVGAL